MLETREYVERLVSEMETERDNIFAMIDQGKSPREISEELKITLDEAMTAWLDIYG